MRTMVPAPGRLSIVSAPLRTRRTRATIASQARCRCSPHAARRGSVARTTNPGSMPLPGNPRSRSRRGHHPCRPAAGSRRDAVNLTALPSTFSRTWRTRSASVHATGTRRPGTKRIGREPMSARVASPKLVEQRGRRRLPRKSRVTAPRSIPARSGSSTSRNQAARTALDALRSRSVGVHPGPKVCSFNNYRSRDDVDRRAQLVWFRWRGSRPWRYGSRAAAPRGTCTRRIATVATTLSRRPCSPRRVETVRVVELARREGNRSCRYRR